MQSRLQSLDNVGASYDTIRCWGAARMESDLMYFSRRAAEEKKAAERSADANARRAHLELAERYEDLVASIAASQRGNRLVS